jgi:signal transduction histidine kinase
LIPGRWSSGSKEFKPDELLEAIQSTAKALAYAKSLEIRAQVSSDMPATVKGDQYWLRQIIINLVSNAVKFTDKGSIQVDILPHDERHWSIRVKDSGRGIPPEALGTIFEPFEQAGPDATVGPMRGSGLGLSIVKQLAALMGGSVDVQSTLGKGSTFTVILPYDAVTGGQA